MYQDYLEEVKKLLHGKDYKVVGKNVIRVDAIEKVTGRAKYTTDFIIENALIVRAVRSPYPHALIKKINAGKTFIRVAPNTFAIKINSEAVDEGGAL